MKIRLDQLVQQRGLAPTREKAQRLIRSGNIRVAGQVAAKPGHTYAEDVAIERIEPEPYVSRGGQKLEAALHHFNVTVKDAVAIDIGASTGGFTDCLLQHGAARVYAVDVGKGQLHWDLRNDSRVVVMESFNARDLKPDSLPEHPRLAVVDVSFISLTKILPAVTPLLAVQAEIVTLIKPQFEAGPEFVGKGGVVRDGAVHQRVIEEIRTFGTETMGLQWVGVLESPLHGPAGNIEFLAYWRKA